MTTALKDSDNLARIERLRPRFERLNELRIRNAADRERAERDLEQARRSAVELAGTDDLDALRRQISENYEQNTLAINEFERTIAEIEAALDAVNGQGA